MKKNPITCKIWIFQANPNSYDIVNALKDEELKGEIHWETKRYKKDIHSDHIGMIWMSGLKGGILAITKILTEPRMMIEPIPEQKWYKSPTDRGTTRLRVKMKIAKNIVDNPLLIGRIKNTEGLQNLSILKMPKATNFKVSLVEWNIINAIINNR